MNSIWCPSYSIFERPIQLSLNSFSIGILGSKFLQASCISRFLSMINLSFVYRLPGTLASSVYIRNFCIEEDVRRLLKPGDGLLKEWKEDVTTDCAVWRTGQQLIAQVHSRATAEG